MFSLRIESERAMPHTDTHDERPFFARLWQRIRNWLLEVPPCPLVWWAPRDWPAERTIKRDADTRDRNP